MPADKRTGPKHPRLGAVGFHAARWLAARLLGAAGFHQLGSNFADERIAFVRAQLTRGETVYLAGLTANKTVGQSLAEQSAEILSLIDGFLAKAGTDKTKLLTATIWLSDIRTVDEFNKVWDGWVVAGSGPARACIEARLQSPKKMIEIQVTAAR